tara:strand:- start:489 stop:710 length:222 start_codon:yes stop_codon:yes gene_type:complete
LLNKSYKYLQLKANVKPPKVVNNKDINPVNCRYIGSIWVNTKAIISVDRKKLINSKVNLILVLIIYFITKLLI